MLAASCGNADAETGLSVITNVRIVTMDGSAPLAGRAVVIESGKVRELIDAADAIDVAGATVIDG